MRPSGDLAWPGVDLRCVHRSSPAGHERKMWHIWSMRAAGRSIAGWLPGCLPARAEPIRFVASARSRDGQEEAGQIRRGNFLGKFYYFLIRYLLHGHIISRRWLAAVLRRALKCTLPCRPAGHYCRRAISCPLIVVTVVFCFRSPTVQMANSHHFWAHFQYFCTPVML